MLFNSLHFAFFLPVVFALHWLARERKQQNILLLVASYFFYSCWDWRFVGLLAFSTFLDFYTGLKIHQSESQKNRKIWLIISIVTNFGFLGFFKYYNFFIDSFAAAQRQLGFEAHYETLQIILPVGISFYTFHGISYVLDIYNEKIKPTNNWIDYSLFVSFFPLLVAGPIERATHLLPQIEKPRSFDYTKAVDGLRQILWGLFKKVVIADNCAQFANLIFDHSDTYSGSTLAVGALFFAFQIYGDFSGYSDIALGTARLFGFELLQNFRFPYFSRNIAEFWRRWHISLSSWFRDYLYIPLRGSAGGKGRRIRNIFIIFLVSGFWHGANWTFLIWGLLNALFMLPSVLLKTNRNHLDTVAEGRIIPSLTEVFQMALTFGLTTFAWIFFRAENLPHAFDYIARLFSGSIFESPDREAYSGTILVLLSAFLIIEWVGRENKYAIQNITTVPLRILRWSFYAFMIFLIGMFMQTSETPFIYFQF